MKKLVILISGRGSNLAAIARAGLPAKISAVISNRADAAGLKLGEQAGIPAEVVDDRGLPSRKAFEAALVDAIDRHSPDLIVLAGFMRVLSADVVGRYSGRMINIHPYLLP